MKLIIDAEGWAYKEAAACMYAGEWKDYTNPNDPGTNTWMWFFRQSEAQEKFTAAIEAMQSICPDHEILLAFGSRTNFRYGIYKGYKGKRHSTIKPAGYVDQLLPWVQKTWPSVVLDGVEADDVCGIEYEEGDVIASRDKDLMTLPGLHLVGEEIVEVSEQKAEYQFFLQTLCGDACDGYPGIKGVGPAKANKVLLGHHPSAWWEVVLNEFKKAGHDYDFALSQARCARILRAGEYDRENKRPHLWNPIPF